MLIPTITGFLKIKQIFKFEVLRWNLVDYNTPQ